MNKPQQIDDDPGPDLLRIPVRYRLGEYLALLREIVRLEQARDPAPASWAARLWNSRAVQRLALAVVVPPMFLLKKILLGDCVFEFTEAGLTRISRRRRASRAWAQVERVHALPGAYLIRLEEGFLPLPYAAFSGPQRAAFLRLLPPRLQEQPDAPN